MGLIEKSKKSVNILLNQIMLTLCLLGSVLQGCHASYRYASEQTLTLEQTPEQTLALAINAKEEKYPKDFIKYRVAVYRDVVEYQNQLKGDPDSPLYKTPDTWKLYDLPAFMKNIIPGDNEFAALFREHRLPPSHMHDFVQYSEDELIWKLV